MERFIDYCDELMIPAQEGKKWTEKDRKFYNRLQKSLSSSTGLMNQMISQKHYCKKRYNKCQALDDLEEFEDWLNKEIKWVQRKLNGKTSDEKSRKFFRDLINLYKNYLVKIENKKKLLQD